MEAVSLLNAGSGLLACQPIHLEEPKKNDFSLIYSLGYTHLFRGYYFMGLKVDSLGLRQLH